MCRRRASGIQASQSGLVRLLKDGSKSHVFLRARIHSQHLGHGTLLHEFSESVALMIPIISEISHHHVHVSQKRAAGFIGVLVDPFRCSVWCEALPHLPAHPTQARLSSLFLGIPPSFCRPYAILVKTQHSSRSPSHQKYLQINQNSKQECKRERIVAPSPILPKSSRPILTILLTACD